MTRYETIERVDSQDILLQNGNWWSRNKQYLSVVDEDLSSGQVNLESKVGKLKVLIKNHKLDNPVREENPFIAFLHDVNDEIKQGQIIALDAFLQVLLPRLKAFLLTWRVSWSLLFLTF